MCAQPFRLITRKSSHEVIMKKYVKIRTVFAFLISVIAFMFSNCTAKLPFIPTLSPNPTPQYYHYTPSEKMHVHLSFGYPSSWTFSENIPDEDFIVIGFGDARFRTLEIPSPYPNDVHGPPNDFGSITIWVMPSTPGQTVDSQLEFYKQAYGGNLRYTILNDYKIILDGFDAGVIEYQLDDPERSPSVMFNRRIFFIIESRIYEILFEVAEKDRGGEFEKGYEYFFNSLEIVQ